MQPGPCQPRPFIGFRQAMQKTSVAGSGMRVRANFFYSRKAKCLISGASKSGHFTSFLAEEREFGLLGKLTGYHYIIPAYQPLS